MTRRPWTHLAAGAVAAAAVLLLALLDGRAALGAWLAALLFWSGLPIGALLLLLMIRLIPGAWGEELGRPAAAAALLLPLALPAILPLLLGLGTLYPWVGEELPGFKGAWLEPAFFVLRALVFLALCTGLALLLLLRPAARGLAAAGAILFVLLQNGQAVDWALSLDPHFHSSGFALYLLSIQATVALALLLLARLRSAGGEARSPLLGGLLIAALLLWAYFAFMQYFIIWSGNLPDGVRWYQARGTPLWSACFYAVALLHALPFALLLAPRWRHGRRRIQSLCLLVLAGKALELAWLVLPSLEESQALALPLTPLAFLAFGLLGAAALPLALRLADRFADRRQPVAREQAS